MKHRILIIDDEKIQVENIKKAISNEKPEIFVDTAFTESDILKKISETYFDIALVDLRMDSFSFNGFKVIEDIIEINPFAKIIITSAYLTEYGDDLNKVLKTGKISGILDKEKFDTFKHKVISEISKIISDYESKESLVKKNLEYLYSSLKNEPDTYTKGKKLEYFVTSLFAQMGFNHIQQRVIDKSQNEVDLVIRNDIRDTFFQKFKPYFLIECKNTIENVDKNQFALFRTKLENTNGLANLGFIVTPKGFKRTSYLEALRSSKEDQKIIFISNVEINQIINADSMVDGLKVVIDEQVKDN